MQFFYETDFLSGVFIKQLPYFYQKIQQPFKNIEYIYPECQIFFKQGGNTCHTGLNPNSAVGA